jgi:uncharacterized protein (DUF2384 family)
LLSGCKLNPSRGGGEMQKVIPLRIEDGRISLDQDMLPKVWLDEPIEAVVKSYGILIKPRSLSQKVRGIVRKRLSYEELDELYSQR